MLKQRASKQTALPPYPSFVSALLGPAGASYGTNKPLVLGELAVFSPLTWKLQQSERLLDLLYRLPYNPLPFTLSPFPP